MRILVTNDDGIRAEGLKAMVEVAQELGEVWVVAPDRERSACGHSLTMRDPLRVKPHPWESAHAFELSGVPTDCVNVGRELMDQRVDLVLSGFNHGPNLGFDITYSGTVAAAMEGALNGIRSVSASMAMFTEEAPLHLTTGKAAFRELLPRLLQLEWPALAFFNVNVPAIDRAELNAPVFCSMGRRVYEDRIEKREDPWGRTYYWQGGVVAMHRDQPNTDVEAINRGHVSVTPITLDWTDRALLDRLLVADRDHPAVDPALER
ncbi:MAG: 5'/3'-nucleotidase SurE [Chthonomonas sp.]|nr:5'/3'-nucleotidase SurE [Chthonomonas sp.]